MARYARAVASLFPPWLLDTHAHALPADDRDTMNGSVPPFIASAATAVESSPEASRLSGRSTLTLVSHGNRREKQKSVRSLRCFRPPATNTTFCAQDPVEPRIDGGFTAWSNIFGCTLLSLTGFGAFLNSSLSALSNIRSQAK